MRTPADHTFTAEMACSLVVIVCDVSALIAGSNPTGADREVYFSGFIKKLTAQRPLQTNAISRTVPPALIYYSIPNIHEYRIEYGKRKHLTLRKSAKMMSHDHES